MKNRVFFILETIFNMNVPRFRYVVSPALSDHYAVCDSRSFRDSSDSNTERFADAKFLLCSPLVSNPNEYAEYMVNFMKKPYE